GRVVICTDPAERLIYNMNIERTGNLSSRQLLRALCAGASQSRQEIFAALRSAPDLQTSASFAVAGR
ncbi:diguanylate cyclase, partial [Methylobacterium sp. J-048]|nr:diguanylate cyclase [Methylobacterium sp. J-048]